MRKTSRINYEKYRRNGNKWEILKDIEDKWRPFSLYLLVFPEES